tara:strand:- start:3248 stop:4165 length:918 start_codon:yes stop_codon:yes gene_type:complete
MKKNNVISIYNKMSYQLLPNIGFTNVTNFRSTVCNTDNLGFRFNDLKKNHVSIFDENKDQKKPEIILTGGSTAMGMAASSDTKTVSSLLSKSSNFHFYNLAVRAYNGFQELLLAQSLVNKFNNLKKIFILSGVNDLYFFLDPNFSKRFPGPQVYGNKLYNIKKEHLNYFKRIKFYFEDNKKKEIKEQLSLKEIIERNLKLWSFFAKSQSVEIVFFLQPFYTWSLDIENREIQKEKMNYGKSEIMDKLDDSHGLIKEIIKNTCLKNNIEFKDLNEIKMDKEGIFVDRVHLNDDGFKEIAEIIKKYI